MTELSSKTANSSGNQSLDAATLKNVVNDLLHEAKSLGASAAEAGLKSSENLKPLKILNLKK